MPFWKKINRFRNKKVSNEIPTLKVNNMDLCSDEEKACAFASKLFNTFNDNTSSASDDTFDQVHKKYIEEQNEADNWRKDPNIKNTSPITLKELQKALKALNQKVTMDATGVNNKLLKRIPNSL